ncbi:MAG: hypothetical protein U5L45_25160 [Saprospiraceae bacterium]|nr:hypothetical protein [Saprospiraceae bacterium]
MKKIILLLSLFLLVKTNTSAQSTMSGYVYDAQSREPLIGAIVFDSLTFYLRFSTLENYAFFAKAGMSYSFEKDKPKGKRRR